MSKEQIILYSNGCPNCNTLKSLLNKNGIDYIENNSIEEMVSLGIDTVPVLGVNEVLYSYKEAKEYINNLKGGIS